MCYVIISKHSHNQSCSETDLVIITSKSLPNFKGYYSIETLSFQDSH